MAPEKTFATLLRVVVAVPTYRRPAQLEALLPLLAAQVEEASGPGRAVELVVVDNDPAGSAREHVGAGTRYVHEPRPGISAVRNRALDEAAGADLLVFIDDDELPGPGWLTRLLGAWEEWRCAAVTGPVVPRFAGRVDPWVLGSGVFDRAHRTSGALLRGGATNNLLLDLAQVRALGLRFDDRLGLTGGEDTLFTHSLVHAGAQVRWCDEAEVVEPVPADRLTRSWVRRRSFRSGSSWSRAEVQLAGGPVARSRLRGVLLARAGGHLVLAGGSLVAAALRRDAAGRGRAACTLASYAGLVTGAFGHVPAEYARPSEAGPVPSGAATTSRREPRVHV